jgi:hypothetical protein
VHWAVKRGMKQMMALLIENGFDYETKNIVNILIDFRIIKRH